MAKGTNPDTQTERDQGEIQGCRYFVGTSIKTQGRRYDLPPPQVPVAPRDLLRSAACAVAEACVAGRGQRITNPMGHEKGG